jgi:hypothetical protein
MTDPKDLEALLERADFTQLHADEVPENDDGIEPGWRIHDLPPDTVWATFLAEGLEEAHAALIVAAVNALPSLLAENERLRAESEARKVALECVLARDAEWSLSGSKIDCGCIRLSRQGEREYENGTCPHQLARTALGGTDDQ